MNDNIWFKSQPMGENTINNMMKTTVAGTSLEESHTNHSARKTTVSKLKKANAERSDIVKVTGHRSVQSFDDYDEADEEEQRRLSSWKPQCWEKANGSFWQHNNCGSTSSGKHERARTTHIGRLIDDSVERQTNSRHRSQVFKLRPWWTRSTTVKCLSSLAARSELLRFQNDNPVLVNAELSLLRMIPIERWLFLIVARRVFFT